MLQLETSHSAFHALCVKPDVKFENQGDTEEVLLTLRAHPITLIPALFNGIVIAVLIPFLSFLLGQFLNPAQLIFLIVFLYFVTFFYLWFQLVNWYFNIGIVTNEQLVDVDFSILSYRDVTRTELGHIEDISTRVNGFISSIFDFGDIYVQTAGTEINTIFKKVPHPARAAHIIEDILKEYAGT